MRRCLLILLLSLQLTAQADPALPSPLPEWHSLLFEEKAFWATARSELNLNPCPQSPDAWCLEASNSVANNRERISLSARPDGSLLERQRFSEGSDRRRKQWLYGMKGITRERLEPDAGGEWRLTSRRELAYPEGGQRVTDPLLLIALLQPGQAGQTFLVNTDLNFYQVSAEPAGEDLVEIDPGLAAFGTRHRDVDLLKVTARLLQPAADKPDFSLLGLSGELLVAFDRETGLPLQVRGKAPRLGYVALTLKSVELREPSP